MMHLTHSVYSSVFFIHILFKDVAQSQIVKISYLCVSCKKEFNLESASNHVKSTDHVIIEETPGSWI